MAGGFGEYIFTLPGSYEAGPADSGIEHSARKLLNGAKALKPCLPIDIEIQSKPCRLEAESWGYRCSCTFQILREGNEFQYAMRTNGKPVALGGPHFPIATRRIQTAMKSLLDKVLNASPKSVITRGLTSLSFSSAWRDGTDSDCVVSLFYADPIIEAEWKEEAESACKLLKLRQLIGRSKKVFLSVPDNNLPCTLRDSVYIKKGLWRPSLCPLKTFGTEELIQVNYEKPVDAFYHPNSFAMIDALEWLLERLAWVRQSREVHLLEMYSGCGAHTVALAKSGIPAEIVAVEIDQRLVNACLQNVKINQLNHVVVVSQGDAGMWARRFRKKPSSNFNVLLVDPPRAGLDKDVCDMAKCGSFEHFLYISCGFQALLRDLNYLSSTFEVINCCQLDLFPRTDSIESLVHLKRKHLTE